MMRQGYGSKDTDKVGKEIADKPMNGPGSEPDVSAMIGGVANKHPTNQDESGGKRNTSQGAAAKAAAARSSIPPYVEGGFRNKAMEHKR
jgi:hypothetical protein